MATFWTVCRWIGAAVILIVVVSMLVGSGWCAAGHPDRRLDRAADREVRKTWAEKSTVEIKVSAKPGEHIVVGGVTIGDSPRANGRPAWRTNWQLCQDHFIYDEGQAPAGRCDHLPGAPTASATATATATARATAVAPVPRPQPVEPSRRAPCPPCEVR